MFMVIARGDEGFRFGVRALAPYFFSAKNFSDLKIKKYKKKQTFSDWRWLRSLIRSQKVLILSVLRYNFFLEKIDFLRPASTPIDDTGRRKSVVL